MTTRYWGDGSNSPPDGNWNTAANWTGDTVPTSSDEANFRGSDADEDTACTCNVAISIASLVVQSGYSGKLDFADSGYSHAVSGDMTLDGTGEWDLGNSSISCGGNFDCKDQATVTGGTATLTLTGSSKSCTWRARGPLYAVVIDGSYTVSNSTSSSSTATLTVNAGKSLTINSSQSFTGTTSVINGTMTSNGNFAFSALTIGAAGLVNGDNSAGTNLTGTVTNTAGGEMAGTYKFGRSWTISGGNYTGTLIFTFSATTRTVTLGSASGQTCKFNNISFAQGSTNTYTVNTNTYDPDIEIAGNLTIIEATAGNLTYTKGSGTITFTGGADQDVNFLGKTVEDIVINKDSQSDKVTLTGDVVTDSLTLTSGILDINAYDLDVSGNMTCAAGTTVDDGAASPTGTVSIGGNLDINGTSGTGCTWTDADIDTLTGTGDADYCTVSNSNNSSGTTIDATDNCTNGTGNTGWNFGVVSGHAAIRRFGGVPFTRQIVTRGVHVW